MVGRQVGENQTSVVYGGRWQSLPRVTGKVGGGEGHRGGADA